MVNLINNFPFLPKETDQTTHKSQDEGGGGGATTVLHWTKVHSDI